MRVVVVVSLAEICEKESPAATVTTYNKSDAITDKKQF